MKNRLLKINDFKKFTENNNIFNPDKEGNYAQLTEYVDYLNDNKGLQTAFNFIQFIEIGLKLRKPTLAIYDHTFHLLGGGQKYGLTIANALKDIFDITLISNKKFTHENIKDWYNLDLSNCEIRIVPIPFFEKKNIQHLDPNTVNKNIPNPFHLISKISGEYDFFVNNSMNEMVYPLSNISIMICHFPERRPTSYFYSDKYTFTVYNSKYTAEWVEKRWKYKPHKHIYPPVDMSAFDDKISKENIILSVARFEIGGSKKQKEMIRSFLKLKELYKETIKDWKLILVGGSQEDNSYLDEIKKTVEKIDDNSIEIKVNISGKELKEYYAKSKIFWHLCGLNQTDPSLIEHFGMTIVEAMQNKLVPIVFDGGGQREIVDIDISGYRINSTSELIDKTVFLIKNNNKMIEMREAAKLKSEQFTREKFEERVVAFFNEILEEFKIRYT